MTMRKQRILGPDDSRNPAARMRHGLTPQQLDVMHRQQRGACLICLTDLTTVTMVIDHDHALARLHGHDEFTGCLRCVRGLLCVTCNTLLGFAHDNIEVLRRAARYVELARETHTAKYGRTP